MSVSKRRFSVTLTPPYVERLDRLVNEGLYMDHPDAIRDALRRLFQFHGVPFTLEEAEAG